MADERPARTIEAVPMLQQQQQQQQQPPPQQLPLQQSDSTSRTASRVHDTHSTGRAKRVQVSVACQRCRQRKIKCDSLRPCAACARRDLSCVYDTEHGETHSQAFKRKYDRLARSHDTYAKIYRMIQDPSGRDVADVVSNIQHRRNHHAALESMDPGRVAYVSPEPRVTPPETPPATLAHRPSPPRDRTGPASSAVAVDPAERARRTNARPTPATISSAEDEHSGLGARSIALSPHNRPDSADDAAQFQAVYRKIAEAQDEATALSLFNRIRAGYSPRTVLRILGNPLVDSDIYSSHLYKLRTSFLLRLAQSTASLQDIANHVTEVFGPGSSFKLPPNAVYNALIDKRVTLSRLGDLVNIANGKKIALKLRSDVIYSGPPIWVPASPWTRLIEQDHDISHLISLFFSFVNPYWWYVEETSFIKDMRSGNINSTYCSPLLVNAILSFTCMFSEQPTAFAEADQLLTRGEHFHREALRLWELERNRPSITNIQALLLLAVGDALRGQDSPGLVLLSDAITLNETLPAPAHPEAMTAADETNARVRQGLSLSVACIEASWHMFFYQRCRTSRETLIDLESFFDDLPDSLVYWHPYPLDNEPVPYRWSLVQQCRHELTCFVHEAVTTITANDPVTNPALLVSSLFDLARRLDEWYRALPEAMRYSKRMSAGMSEFHAHCAGVNMHILDWLRKRLVENPHVDFAGSSLRETRSNIQRHATQYAILAGHIAQSYRETYGVKIVLPYMFHMTAIASFRLLESLKNPQDSFHSADQTGQPGAVRSHGERAAALIGTVAEANLQDEDDVIALLLEAHSAQNQGEDGPYAASDTATAETLNKDNITALLDKDDVLKALEECFRFLLGAGFQHLLPRGIAQSVYVTAIDMKIDLPESFLHLLSMLANTSWDPDDLKRFDSYYPNYAFKLETRGDIDEAQMVNLARRFGAKQ